MSPAKKKAKTAARKPKPPPEKVAVPIPANAVAVPAPAITPTQRKFFAVVKKKDLIGFVCFVVGLTLILGYVLSDKEHLHDTVVLYVGSGLTLFGALMMDLKNVGSALKELVSAGKDLRKSDPPASGGV